MSNQTGGFSRAKHGPWAVIAGASDGLGEEFAHYAAAAGINVMLVARRQPVLQQLADTLIKKYGVQAIPAVVDLSVPDAAAQMFAAAGDREVGLFVYNAGGDTTGKPFHQVPLPHWQALLRRNIDTLVASCHAFGEKMAERGRGGILLVGSNAAFGGAPRMALYTATKAFDVNFGESLWAELKPRNVDVLNLVFSTSSTPTFVNTLTAHGIPLASVGDVATPADVAGAAVAAFGNGPTLVYAHNGHAEDPQQTSESRRERVVHMATHLNAFFGEA